MRWPAEREKLFVMLWTQGLSPKEIATQLGVSVSTIIGKRNRMKLPEREAAPETKKRLPPLPVDRSRETGAARGTWNVRYADKSDTHCLMFVGGESRETGLICGRERQDGKPYCSECCKLCYEPAEAKRRAA